MRIFVMGASGYIGNAVAKAFRSKGHTVYGLVRSQEKADELRLAEIIPVMGDLNKPESFLIQLDHMEAVINCAFDHVENGVQKDAEIIELITKTLSKSLSPRIFIYTSGIWVYGSKSHEIVDESSDLNPIELVKWRPIHEQKVLEAASSNLKTVVIRPGIVYGNSGGLMKLFFNSIQSGSIPFIQEGDNHWSMIHVDDLAHAYVSAVEKELSQVILNVVGEGNPTVKEIAEAVAVCGKIEGKVHSLSVEDAEKVFGNMWRGFMLDLKVDNSRIKRLLKWQTHHAPFIHEIDLYYQAWLATQEMENSLYLF